MEVQWECQTLQKVNLRNKCVGDWGSHNGASNKKMRRDKRGYKVWWGDERAANCLLNDLGWRPVSMPAWGNSSTHGKDAWAVHIMSIALTEESLPGEFINSDGILMRREKGINHFILYSRGGIQILCNGVQSNLGLKQHSLQAALHWVHTTIRV